MKTLHKIPDFRSTLIPAIAFVAIGFFASPIVSEAAIQFVGSTTASGTNSAYSMSLTALDGGIGSAPAQDDIVIIVNTFMGTVNGNPGVGTAGYTETGDLYQNDTNDVNFSVNYKIMSSSPDTTVSCNGSPTSGNASTCVALVFRGVDTTTPMDVATTTAGAINSEDVNCAAITPVTSGAYVICAGGAAGASVDTAIATINGYTHAYIQFDSTNSAASVMAYKAWSGSGAEDPPAFVMDLGTASANSWASVTLALRPEPVAPTVTTQSASSVATTTAIFNGNITATDGASATTRGFAVGTSSTLVGANVATTTDTGSFSTGAFTGNLWSIKSAWNGPGAAPTLGDLDNDGDLDIMEGHSDGISYAYENTGNASSPTWTARSGWNAPDVGDFSDPLLVDLDNDGDLDLLIGETVGVAKGYENTGSASSPTWTAKAAWNTPDVGDASFPAAADLDNDGDYDLLIGESLGVAKGYENTGSASSPTWTAKAAWNTSDVGNYGHPALADLDNDGDFDLIMGASGGANKGFENTGSITSPTWTARTSWDKTSSGDSPAMGDLDNDGDNDLLLGTTGTDYAYQHIRLVCNTTYYTRAYATNSAGTGYGAISSSFTTSACDSSTTLDQLHYRWRSDDGSETAATYAAAEDTPLTSGVYIGDRGRLRFLISNTGSGSATNYTYQLEHASSSCTVWQKVPTAIALVNEHVVMDPSPYLDDNSATTDLSGLTNPGGKTFVAGSVNEFSNPAAAHTLTNTQFTELEYSIRSTGYITPGTTYCFRLTNAGSTTGFTYSVQPQIIVQAIVNRPAGGGGSGSSSSGGESSSGGGSQQSGGGQGGGGGGGAGGEGGGYPYPTPQGGGGSGGGGGDSGYLFGQSNLAGALNAVSETIENTMKMINRMFIRD